MPRFLQVLAHELTTLPTDHPDRPRKLRELRDELPRQDLTALCAVVENGPIPIPTSFDTHLNLINLNLAAHIIVNGLSRVAATPLGLAVLRA